MQIVNKAYYSKEEIYTVIIPQLQQIVPFDGAEIKKFLVRIAIKHIPQHNRTYFYPSFELTMNDGRELTLKRFDGWTWLHNTNFLFPNLEWIVEEYSLFGNVFYVRNTLDLGLYLQKEQLLNYIHPTDNWILTKLSSYTQKDLPYTFDLKGSNLEMYFGYFLINPITKEMLSIPKTTYKHILDSRL